MQLHRYQWAGLYAGLLLFSGAWLTAYYNNWMVSLLTMLAFGAVLYAAVRVERRSNIPDHIKYGATAGLLAGLVARLLGFFANRWVLGATTTAPTRSYGFVNDYFANLLNGGLVGTLSAIVMSVVLGACVAFFEPERRQATSKKGGK